MDKKTIIIIALLLVCAVVAGYMFGAKSGANVPDFGKRADEAREQLDEVEQQRQSVGNEIGSSRQSISAVRSELAESQSINKSNAELIADSQQVLRRVRARGAISN
ncbi:MAG: hypothetical protein N2491_01620 [Negativicutes bacterium]|nr:hypothetical protein [Negativicutes bacterium]